MERHKSIICQCLGMEDNRNAAMACKEAINEDVIGVHMGTGSGLEGKQDEAME